ncbi:deoxyribodipyrimidine photolyase-related protein [Methylobacterium sp. 4-46]|uniref:cryptochrome/photolyase family protein n=1 Tax=unclassified Methylobacterium TaxID=2615210 RepID=UPI000152E406|nr:MULTISPECIES: cryptochrome/photolyase family protein [Methylobacterium]ACA19770.1 deoxyribodipyrimidine photolyase-related protein [Methylobacterium sp. 4-46]WFT78958.1 cryptochrome/photolyase family protein [Methylobacterium nodulans]
MRTLRFVLGDQLHPRLAGLTDLDPARDVVLMAEVAEEATYVRHHKQKIALVLSAMRHFAAELRARGVAVDYVALEDAGNTGSFGGELARAVARHRPDRVVVTEPGEWRVLAMMRDWSETLGVPVEIRADIRFLCPREAFARWAEGRASLRMETFYRAMRRRTGFLMRDGAPVGGRWNFDQENRRKLPADHRLPARLRFPPDAVTREVIALVARRFPGHFGDLDGFGWPVTREQALAALRHFLDECLPAFGDYQDAMRAGAPFLYHALLAPALNLGLLDAEEVCRAAERAHAEGRAPLNAVEGFIRQILGWREYVRGLYWARMPDYAATNALGAARDLPWFYWSGETAMRCLADSVAATRAHAHAHHIQRLMVLGNFALLAGIRPAALEEWFLVVYADAYEWVELPNVHGMALWADGGLLASKPYAASGAYIDRMSDYCRACAYDVRLKSGTRACPFNYLYWAFLITHAERLSGNPRLAMPYRTLARMPASRRREILADAARFLAGLDGSEGQPQAGRQEEAGTPDLFLVEPSG